MATASSLPTDAPTSQPTPSRCRNGGPAGPPLGLPRATDSIARRPHDSPAASPVWPPVARGRFSSTPPVDDPTAPRWPAGLVEHSQAPPRPPQRGTQIHEPRLGAKRRPHTARQRRLLQLPLGLAQLGHELGPPRVPFQELAQQVCPLVSHIASRGCVGMIAAVLLDAAPHIPAFVRND